jgi:hypothetical protein
MLGVVIDVFAAAGSALGGQAATNPQGEFIDLSVRVSPPVSGTAKAPRGVGVSFDSFAGNRLNAAAELNSNSIKVRFRDNFKDNALRFPSCRIDTKAISKCPRKTQIGTGRAEAELAGAHGAAPTFIPAKLRAYNGEPLSGRAPTIIFVASLNGTPAAELDFTIKKQGRGLAFDQIVVPSSGGPVIGITRFSVKIPDQTITRKVHGKSVKVHMIEAPTSCHGAWAFSQTNTFTGGAPPLTATDSQPCVKG